MKRLLIAAVLASLMLTGCTGGGFLQGDDTMNVLTNHEKELINSVYKLDVQKERLETGELYGEQKTMLQQIRSLQSYLEQKYPGVEFGITDVSLTYQGVDRNLFHFSADGEGYYTARTPKDTCEFEDNYFGEVLADRYAEALHEMIPQAVAVGTVITGYGGREICASLTAEQMMELGSELVRDSFLYFHTQSGADAAREVLEQKQIYGSYELVVSSVFSKVLNSEDCNRIFRSHPELCTYEIITCGY